MAEGVTFFQRLDAALPELVSDLPVLRDEPSLMVVLLTSYALRYGMSNMEPGESPAELLASLIQGLRDEAAHVWGVAEEAPGLSEGQIESLARAAAQPAHDENGKRLGWWSRMRDEPGHDGRPWHRLFVLCEGGREWQPLAAPGQAEDVARAVLTYYEAMQSLPDAMIQEEPFGMATARGKLITLAAEKKIAVYDPQTREMFEAFGFPYPDTAPGQG